MGRGRGKGKKQNSNASREDLGSGEEEKIPVSRRRGRPQKIFKDDTEEEVEKVEEDGNNADGSILNNDVKKMDATENGTKRKRSAVVQKTVDVAEKENGVAANKSVVDDSTKSPGYRKSSHRRKSKPQRAAEAVVECR